MPEDSTIRIRQILDLSDFQAKSAQSKAQIAQQLGEMKAQYANATQAAKTAINDLKSAEQQLGKFAAAGSAEAKAALEGYRQKVEQTTAEQIRLAGALEVTQTQIAALNPKIAGMGGNMAAARLEAAALSGSVTGIEMGLARLAATSSTLGPLMQAALPVALAAAFGEILVTGIRNAIDKLRDWDKEAKEDFRSELNLAYRVREAMDKSTESMIRLPIEGKQGFAQINAEIHANEQTLELARKRLGEYRQQLEGMRGMRDYLRPSVAEAVSGGLGGAVSTAEKLLLLGKERDQIQDHIKNLESEVSQITLHQIDLEEKRRALQVKPGIEAEKESLENRKAALEAAREFEKDNIDLSSQELELAHQKERIANEDEIRRQKERGEQFKLVGRSEQSIILETYQQTVQANELKYQSALKFYEALKRLAEERGRATGANVKPEIEGFNKDEMQAHANQLKADIQAEKQLNAELAADAKKTAEAVDKALGAAMHARMEDIRHTGEEAHKAFEQEIRDAKATAQEEIAESRASTDERIRSMNLDRIMSLGKMREEVAIVRQSVAQQMDALRQLEEFERQKGTLTIQEEQRIARERVEIARRANQQILQIYRQEYQQIQQIYNQMTGTITRSFNQWLAGQKTFRQAMREMWNELVMNVIEDIEKMAAKWVEEHLLMKAANALFHTETLAQDSAADAAKVAKQAATNVLIVQSEAGVGAAAGFASVMETVPFPANIAIAPGVAAAAFGQIEAFGASASLEHGGIVPGQQGQAVPVVAHGGEMYLGSKLSQTVQRLSGGGGGQGGHTSRIHVNFSPTINHPMTESDLRPHARTIAQMVQSEMKKFNR